MIATPHTEQRLAALYATLAKATMACDRCKGKGKYEGAITGEWITCGIGAPNKEWRCQGTGEVAMFEGMRQVCDSWGGGYSEGRHLLYHVPEPGEYSEGQEWGEGKKCRTCREPWGEGLCSDNPCHGCNGTGWQVRAGGMEDALAGLTTGQAHIVFGKIQAERYWDDPMPDRDTILVAALELVCQVKDLEVADA